MSATRSRILNKLDKWNSRLSNLKLGKTSAGAFYTNALAKFCLIGTDGNSSTGRVLPISATAAEGVTADVSVVLVAGIIDDTPPFGYMFNTPTPPEVYVTYWPLTGLIIEADSYLCDGSNLPTAGSIVYFKDNALLSTSAADSALVSPIGRCEYITSDTFYRIQFF